MHCGYILLKQTNQLTSLDDEDEFYFFWLEILYADWLVGKTVLESKDIITVLRRRHTSETECSRKDLAPVWRMRG